MHLKNIFFKRGNNFTGTPNLWTSGTASASIIFMPYSSGTAPVFGYALPDAGTPLSTGILLQRDRFPAGIYYIGIGNAHGIQSFSAKLVKY